MPRKRDISQSPMSADPPVARRVAGGIGVKMACGDVKNEWNFNALSAPDAIEQARKICQDNGYRFPYDVVVWEFTQRI